MQSEENCLEVRKNSANEGLENLCRHALALNKVVVHQLYLEQRRRLLANQSALNLMQRCRVLLSRLLDDSHEVGDMI